MESWGQIIGQLIFMLVMYKVLPYPVKIFKILRSSDWKDFKVKLKSRNLETKSSIPIMAWLVVDLLTIYLVIKKLRSAN